MKIVAIGKGVDVDGEFVPEGIIRSKDSFTIEHGDMLYKVILHEGSVKVGCLRPSKRTGELNHQGTITLPK